MNFKTLAVTALVFAAQIAPLPALALGGSKSGAESAPKAAPGPIQPALDLSDIAACTTPPAEGEETVCACAPGARAGSVWGTGPFTGDSDICTAARFSGAIGPDGGAVRLLGLPGMNAYEGGTANGVTTRSWGGYGRSFSVAPVAAAATAAQTAAPGALLEQCARLPEGVDSYSCSCQGSAAEARGSVWGSDPFTADSSICAAAQLTGYIEAGQPGNVYVLRIRGLEHYSGTSSNGVKSNDWGAYKSSFVFDWNQ